MDIFDCKCENEMQDNMYGKHKRVFNSTTKGYRCTVCNTERTSKDKSSTIASKKK